MEIGILFDLDGTLLDTLEDLADGVNHVLKERGWEARSVEEVRRFVGNGVRRLMEQAVPEGADVEEALAAFQSYYAAHCRIKTRPYEGIPEALKELSRTYPMAIVSNKPDIPVKQLCGQLFPGIFALGEREGCPRKPAPDMVYRAMEVLGVGKCVYVGDSDVDVVTAKNAGAPCVSVLWGFRNREEIAAAGGKIFCQTPDQLPLAIARAVKEGIHGQ